MTDEEQREYLAHIHNDDTRAAFLHLINALPQHGLTPSTNTGKLRAVRLHDEGGRYLFSWIVNPHHLLFYIRKPALNVVPHLAASTGKRLAELQVKKNPVGEVTIRVEGKQHAEAVTGFLTPQLPLTA